MEHVLSPLVGLVIGTFAAYRLASLVVRVFRADRARRQRLRALERDPSLEPGDPGAAAARIDSAVTQAMREDLTLTGAILALMSVAAVFAGRSLAFGPWAVGLYTAGLIGIVAGVALALVGGVLRTVTAPLLRDDDRGA